ncbi:hypothetical protein CRUP_006670 [Coryphaenoides rupestris]|nr:hypothetical protein CRUP_006670 [Coryphaenoides rupestris]
MFPHHREREQPFFSARAHVFQIDPSTKRNWIPASKHAVTVSFFYDANRNVYRIISVGGTKAIINCSITPSMTFTKTSQKFGQWADSRANTVYGLGFATEQQLHQVQEQPFFSARAHVFQIDPSTKRNWIPASKHAVTVSFFYDANRNVYRIISVGGTKAIINCSITPSMTFTKTSQKFGQWADSRANTVYGLGFATEQQLHQFSEKFKEVKDATRLAREKSQDKELANTALSIAAPQDLSDELQSPPVMCINGPEDKLFRSQSADITLSSEKERIKKMLSEGSICEMNLEAELFTLQDSNNKLVAALHEANANVDQWKKQLAAYQEETERLRDQVAELEAHGGHGPSDLLKDELTQSLEELEALLKAKDEEIHILQSKKLEYHEMERDRDEAMHRLQEMEMRNSDLERRVQNSEQNLNNTLEDRDRVDNEIQRAIEILDIKIFDLNDLRQSLVKLIDK